MASSKCDEGIANELLDEVERLESFASSHGWYRKFIARTGLTSRKGADNGWNFDEAFVDKAWHNMKKELAHHPLSCIMNADEVVVLYRSLPSKSLSQQASAYKRIKDGLTAVLTVFADGTKAPLTIIGKS